MSLRKPLLLAGASALVLSPAAAGAQEGYAIGAPFGSGGLSGDEIVAFEAGGGFGSEESFKFGEYSGLEDEGFFVIGNLDALLRDDSDDDTAYYLDLSARNLGLESREIELEGGAQGLFGARLRYREIPHYLIEDARTPYRDDGDDRLTLPPPDSMAVPPTDPTEVGTAFGLREVDIENERQQIGAGLFWSPLENLRIDVDYRHEVREGTKTTYGVFGVTQANPRAVALPEAVDYEVDEIDATAVFTLGKLQLQAAYNGSFFNDRNESLTWDNAYTGGNSGWDDTPDEGRLALDPDNQSHSFSLSGGYDILPTLRLTGSFGYGIMLQDEDFLPYTTNPDLAPATALPRDSLDGEVQILRADLGLSARPIRDLDLSARYRFHDRDNKTPREDYARVINDVGAQDPTTELRTNLPHSYTQHVVNLETGYRVVPGTKVSLTYEFERMERTFAERDHTNDHEVGGKLRSRPFETVSAWLSYAHAWRDGDAYDGNAPFLESHPLETDPAAFENIPATRKFHLADRDRDQVKGAVTVTPLETLSVTLSGSYTLDDYDKTDIGLTESELVSATLDASFSPVEGLTTYAFYTFDRLTYDQDGLEWQSFAPAQVTDPTRRWSTESEDRAHTIGVGATWAVIPDRLDLSADAVVSWAKTRYDLDNGGNAAFGASRPLPDLESTFRSLQVAADYKVRDNVSLRLGYRYEFRDTEDFALDDVAPDSSSNTLLFGNPAPDYTAHVVALSTRISF